jgi:hypothetical protein
MMCNTTGQSSASAHVQPGIREDVYLYVRQGETSNWATSQKVAAQRDRMGLNAIRVRPSTIMERFHLRTTALLNLTHAGRSWDGSQVVQTRRRERERRRREDERIYNGRLPNRSVRRPPITTSIIDNPGRWTVQTTLGIPGRKKKERKTEKEEKKREEKKECFPIH